MTTTTSPAALVPVAPVFTNSERLALAGLLAGVCALTRQACELDLRQCASWCSQHQLRLFQARRADIECFTRDPGDLRPGKGYHHPAVVHRRRFYRYAERPRRWAAASGRAEGTVAGAAH